VNGLRLASGSPARRAMLEAAGIAVEALPARIDEEGARVAMIAEGYRPRDIADGLAELKARKVGEAHPEGLTLGADQVLEHQGTVIVKAAGPGEARQLLARLSGDRHVLWSAAVIYEGGRPIWRHVGQARMKMRTLSPEFIDSYVQRYWEDIRHCVGCYRVEAEGIRLFEAIGTDYHSVLGLPLMPLLNYLATRGLLTT
jgi:septum formation protein